jgi:uncharacterized MnhB-related membrane protein
LNVLDTLSVVYASIYLILSAPGKMPDEGLLGAVVLPAISRIKAVKAELMNELQKLR